MNAYKQTPILHCSITIDQKEKFIEHLSKMAESPDLISDLAVKEITHLVGHLNPLFAVWSESAIKEGKKNLENSIKRTNENPLPF